MVAAKRRPTATTRRRIVGAAALRYTIDASVFVTAFNPSESGHAASLTLLTTIHHAGDPVILPSLVLVEIASALARASDDTAGAVAFANAIANLPHVTLVPLTPAGAHQAAELAAQQRLRGTDAVYAAVARRYGTTLVTRDEQQRARGVAVVPCATPEEELATRS